MGLRPLIGAIMKDTRRYTVIEVDVDGALFTFKVPVICKEEDFNDACRLVADGMFNGYDEIMD